MSLIITAIRQRSNFFTSFTQSFPYCKMVSHSAVCSLCQLTLRNIFRVTVQHNESIHYALACILPFPIGPSGRYSSQADKWEINKLLITLDDIVTQCTKISTQLFKNKQIKGTRSKRMLNDFEVVIYFLFNDTLNTLLNDLDFFSFKNSNIFFT